MHQQLVLGPLQGGWDGLVASWDGSESAGHDSFCQGKASRVGCVPDGKM